MHRLATLATTTDLPKAHRDTVKIRDFKIKRDEARAYLASLSLSLSLALLLIFLNTSFKPI